jgi:DNA-binding HxlR family transcriptional regulator
VFDPVARALDLIGDRWTLVLVRHLLRGPRGFHELRVRTGIAPRVLSSRLRQLTTAGLVEPVAEDGRSGYAVTERGRSLEPLVAALARWYVHHALLDFQLDTQRFTETSALSILESLPFLLREDRARDVTLTFEIRLTGEGGGVWTVRIADGRCAVAPGFAERADVRYTADARVWCSVALGFLDAREAMRRGQLSKEGGREAMDEYFHQIARLPAGDLETSARLPAGDLEESARAPAGDATPPRPSRTDGAPSGEPGTAARSRNGRRKTP